MDESLKGTRRTRLVYDTTGTPSVVVQEYSPEELEQHEGPSLRHYSGQELTYDWCPICLDIKTYLQLVSISHLPTVRQPETP